MLMPDQISQAARLPTISAFAICAALTVLNYLLYYWLIKRAGRKLLGMLGAFICGLVTCGVAVMTLVVAVDSALSEVSSGSRANFMMRVFWHPSTQLKVALLVVI